MEEVKTQVKKALEKPVWCIALDNPNSLRLVTQNGNPYIIYNILKPSSRPNLHPGICVTSECGETGLEKH